LRASESRLDRIRPTGWFDILAAGGVAAGVSRYSRFFHKTLNFARSRILAFSLTCCEAA
jgi:hypothetical protein